MAEGAQERINRYLQDTISAERNFEKALSSFGETGDQPKVQNLMNSLSQKAKSQHERLTALLEKRGGSPSDSKTTLAQTLAFSPLSAQMGQSAGEKNTQHLIVTIGAAAAEMAMYESLASAATQAHDNDVASLARMLQSEERDDYNQVWAILNESARSSFQSELGKGKKPEEIIAKYVEDAIAAEKSFETQLDGFAKGEEDSTARKLFEAHARETKAQYEMLTERLKKLGKSPSMLKSVLAHLFGMAPRAAQTGHDAAERLTQNLMMAYAVENAEVATYEALAEISRQAADSQTEQLARSVQQQEKLTAEKVWAQLSPTAQRAIAAGGAA